MVNIRLHSDTLVRYKSLPLRNRNSSPTEVINKMTSHWLSDRVHIPWRDIGLKDLLFIRPSNETLEQDVILHVATN